MHMHAMHGWCLRRRKLIKWALVSRSWSTIARSMLAAVSAMAIQTPIN